MSSTDGIDYEEAFLEEPRIYATGTFVPVEGSVVTHTPFRHPCVAQVKCVDPYTLKEDLDRSVPTEILTHGLEILHDNERAAVTPFYAPFDICIYSLRTKTSLCRLRGGHAGQIQTMVSILEGGTQRLASSDNKGVVVVWDPENGKSIVKFPSIGEGSIGDVCFAPEIDRNVLFVSRVTWRLKRRNELCIWVYDLVRGQFFDAFPRESTHRDSIRVLTYAGNRQILSAADDKTIRIWEERSGMVGEFPIPHKAYCVTAAEDLNLVLVGLDCGWVSVYDTRMSDTCVTSFQVHYLLREMGSQPRLLGMTRFDQDLFVSTSDANRNETVAWNSAGKVCCRTEEIKGFILGLKAVPVCRGEIFVGLQQQEVEERLTFSCCSSDVVEGCCFARVFVRPDLCLRIPKSWIGNESLLSHHI